MTLIAPSAKALYNEYAIPAFDEAALLYHQRKHKYARRLGSLSDIAEVDQRLQNNLDHLRYFHEAAKFLSEERYDLADDADAFVSTYLGFQFDDISWIQKVFATYLQQEDTTEAITIALAWMPWSVSSPWIKRFLSSKDLQHKVIALRVCGLLNQHPHEILNKFMQREDCIADPQVYEALIQLIGQFKVTAHVNTVYEATAHANNNIRNAACQACLLMGDTRILNIAMRSSLESNETFQLLAPFIIRSQTIEANQSWFTQALKAEDITLELKILAVGDYGDPRGIPWLINHMDQPTIAPFAAYAFRQITGVDLERHKLIKTEEELALSDKNPTENEPQDDEADNSFPSADNSLPFPDREHVHAFWSAYHTRFIPGQRYVLGRQHLPTDLRYLEFLNSLKNANTIGDRNTARQELAQINTGPASSDFIPPQHRN